VSIVKQRARRVLAILFLFGLALVIVHIRRTTSAPIIKLPKFRAADVTGHEFRSEYLQGRIAYIQFINASRIDDIASLNAVYRDWEKRELLLVAVTNNSIALLSRIAFDTTYMRVLEDPNGKIADRFGSSYTEGSYYLFNQSGLLVASGKNDSAPELGIKNEFMRALNNRSFSISDFIPIGENIIAIEWLRDLDILRKSSLKCCVFALFNSVCYSCQSRMILHNLNEIYLMGRDKIQVVIILSQDYAESDIDNLRSQFNVSYPIIRATNSLYEKWSLLNGEYSIDLNNIIFVIDQKGTITRLAYPGCDCIWDIYNFVKSIIEVDNGAE